MYFLLTLVFGVLIASSGVVAGAILPSRPKSILPKPSPKALPISMGLTAPLVPTVKWVYNVTLNGGQNTATSVLASLVDPRVIFAFISRNSWQPHDVSAMVAVDAQNGKLLWTSANFSDPSQCELLETSTTVACLGGGVYIVLNRTTGDTIARNFYGKVMGIFLSNLGGSSTHVIDSNAVGYIIRPIFAANATVFTYHARVLDLQTGVEADLGSWTSSRPLTAVWFLNGTRGRDKSSSPAFTLSAFLWSMYNAPMSGSPCNAMERVTFSTGGAARTIDYSLPSTVINVPQTPKDQYCTFPQVSLNAVDSPIPHPIAFITCGTSTDLYCFNTTNGTLINVVSVAAIVPPGYGIGTVTAFDTQERDYFLVIGGDSSVSPMLGVYPKYNESAWMIEVPSINGMITDTTSSSITVGGMENSRVTRINIYTGLYDFSVVMPEPEVSPNMMWVDLSPRYFMAFQPPLVNILDRSSGVVLASMSLQAGVLNGGPSTDAWQERRNGPGLDLFVGMSAQLACIEFA